MSKVNTKEEVVKYSNQPQKKETNNEWFNNLDSINDEVKKIYNSEFLKECIQSLEGLEDNYQNSITVMRERISEIEYIHQIEEEVKMNLSEIDDLHRFIEVVCDTDEDIHDPYNRIDDLIETNNELNEEITKFYENLNH